MAEIKKRGVLLTPRFQVAFPQLAELKVFQEGQKGRYSCVALFTVAEIKQNPAELQKWNAIKQACDAVAREKFKKSYEELKKLSGTFKLPFHLGEEKEQYAGFGKGIVYFTMSAYTRQPDIVARDGKTALSPGDIYPGCYARASVNPFASEKWKSISIGMNNIQFLGDGERLDGGTSAEEDFGSDPAVFDDGDESAGDFGGESDLP